MAKRGVDTISKQEVLDHYVNKIGASLKSAADELGCSREVFRRALHKFGYEAKPKTRNFRRKSEILQLSDHEWLAEQLETKTVKQIAKELGTSPGNVSDRISRYNIRSKALTKSQAIKDGLRKAFPEGAFGENASNWQGGRRHLGSGYIYIYAPDHPFSAKSGCVMEHRLVAEEHIGRYLHPHEIVHHKDGNKSNNAWENLEVTDRKTHVSTHFNAIKDVAELAKKVEHLESELQAALRQVAQLKRENRELREA